MRHWKWCVPAAAAVGLVALSSAAAPKKDARSAQIRRGEYLVNVGGCNDCHTPWKMGPNGPEPDMTRMLSGHPEDLTMPPAPSLTEPWMAATSATFTAWSGPWGTSFSQNLTPDETGLAKWTEQNFVEAMRTGRHMGRGRPILPPMPWMNVGKMTDDDLKATFAYLRSIKPIKNRVPDPAPPPEAPGGSQGQGSVPPQGGAGATPGVK